MELYKRGLDLDLGQGLDLGLGLELEDQDLGEGVPHLHPIEFFFVLLSLGFSF